jgi:hypothetical protein
MSMAVSAAVTGVMKRVIESAEKAGNAGAAQEVRDALSGTIAGIKVVLDEPLVNK